MADHSLPALTGLRGLAALWVYALVAAPQLEGGLLQYFSLLGGIFLPISKLPQRVVGEADG